MKAPVWTEFVCRTCADTTGGEFNHTGRIRVRSLMRAAKEARWVFKHGECFCSERCVKTFERDECAAAAIGESGHE